MRTRMTWLVVAGMLAAGGASAQQSVRHEVELQAALRSESVDGDLKAAIKQYEALVSRYAKSDPAVAAQALVRMGRCYEKLGDTEARKAYERVMREFGDQKDSVETARVRLVALGKPTRSGNIRFVSRDRGIAAASPDGRLLLQYGAQGGVELRDLRTGQTRPLINMPLYSARFSPDSRRIAFFRRANGRAELYVIETNGAGERIVWRTEAGSGATSPGWFPDSTRLLVLVGRRDAPCELTAVSTVNGSATTLWRGPCGDNMHTSQISPDGRFLAIQKRVQKEPVTDELWRLSLEDKTEELLFRGRSRMDSPQWMPDGKGIVFLSDRRSPGASVDLWLLRMADGKPIGFPDIVKSDLGSMSGDYPDIWAADLITRDGTYYFTRGQTQEAEMRQLLTTQFDLVKGKITGTASFVSRTGGLSRSPSFSRDGRWLAYLLHGVKLVVQSMDSGEERVVPMRPAPKNLDWAVMYPDGRSVLVFASHPEDGWGLYRVDVASGKWSLLKSEPSSWPNGISPDGRIIYFNRRTRGPASQPVIELVAWDTTTGEERQLRKGKGTGVFALSYDGKQIAVIWHDGNEGVIEVLPAAGGPAGEIHRIRGIGEDSQGLTIAWEPDGRHLLFTISQPHPGYPRAYMRVPAEGGQAQPTGIQAEPDGPGQFPRGFGAMAVHPNGRQVVYVAVGAQHTPPGVWAVENFLPGFKAAK